VPLASTREAIGAVTELIQSRLSTRLSNLNITVGRPEAASRTEGRKLNLFLYRIGMDGHLKNVSLDEGQPAPLWLTLYYLLTGYDEGNDSDSPAAHRLLSRGLAALHELNFLRPGATDTALAPNPESLKITFDEADVELLSKIMQGGDERYRVSAALQVRPVLVVPEAEPAFAPLVLTVGPPTAPGVAVIPTVGARIEAMEPERFEAGDEITLTGFDLSGSEEIWIGATAFGVTAAPEGELRTRVPLNTTLAAGAYAVRAARVLPSGRRFFTSAVLGRMAPTVTGVTVNAPLTVIAVNGQTRLHGSLTVSGRRLGGPEDAVFVSFYREGSVALVLEVSGSPPQTSLVATVPSTQALPPGEYRLILRVNGEQGANSPAINWA